MILKICSDCKISQNIDNFYNSKQAIDGKQTKCKICQDKYIDAWQKNNKYKRNITAHKSRLKNIYKISEEEYNKLLDIQNYTCKTCDTLHTEQKKLSVDHCHITNKVRGLLCNKCNVGLGMFQNNIQTIKNMVNYLELSL